MPALWKDIVVHPYFLGKSDEEKLRIAQNYFSKNFDSNSSFREKSDKDPEYRPRVWRNFVSKAIPPERWKTVESDFVKGLKRDTAASAKSLAELISPSETAAPEADSSGTDPFGIYAPKSIEEVPTGLKSVARGVSRDTAHILESGGTIAEVAGKIVGSETLAEAGEKFSREMKKVAESFPQPEEWAGKSVWDNPELLLSGSYIIESVFETLPSFAASILPAGAAHKMITVAGNAIKISAPVISRIALLGAAATGGVAGGSLEGASTYREIKEKGGTDEQAILGGFLMSAFSAGLNTISLGNILSKAGIGNRILNYLSKGAVEAGTEYLEEPAEIAAKIMVEQPRSNPDYKPPTKEEIISQLKSGTNVLLPSFLIGTGAGAASGAKVVIPKRPPKRFKKWWESLSEEERQEWEENLRSGAFARAAKKHVDLSLLLASEESAEAKDTESVTEKPPSEPLIEPSPGSPLSTPGPPPAAAPSSAVEPVPPSQLPVGEARPPIKTVAQGAEATVRTERGTQVATRYAVVEAGQLIASHDTILRPNKEYPKELQPRDRTRRASDLQVDRIARELAPDLLGESPLASQGAPIIGPDGVVESGNGRVIALRRVYESGSENADTYKDWLRDNADKFGLTREQVDSAKQPILVRIRNQGIDRIRFVQEANETSVATMSPSERAMTDAKNLPAGILSQMAFGETGEIIGASRILGSIVPSSEMGSYLMPDGSLNQDGIRRVRNAIFAKAYSNPMALEKIAESTDPNVKNIATAMMEEAPRFSAIRDAIAKNELYPLDIGPSLGDAMAKMSWLREQGKQTVEMYLSQLSADGRNLYGQQELTPVGMDILSTFDVHKRSSRMIRAILAKYADFVVAEGSPAQGVLFGTKTPPTVSEIWQRAKTAVEEEAGLVTRQAPLFAEREVPVAGGTRLPPTPPTGAAPTEQRPRIGYDDPLKPEQLAYLDDIPPSFLELPELIELVKAINDGKIPKVAARLRRGILGYYSPRKKRIVISSDLWQDDPITGMTGEERARKTVAHEIFHLVDDLPEHMISQRGNILGRLASLKKFMGDMIDDMPRDISEVVTAEERAAARKRIAKEAREASSDKEERKRIAKEMYATWIAQEVASRRVITKDEIIKELKAVTQAWKPFDESADPKFTKYRYSGVELYADAGSVLINRPELLRSLAPKFTDAFFAYFERKPEAQEAYNDIQDIIRGGKVEEVRGKTVSDMYSAGDRVWGGKRIQKKKQTAADMWELFKREMIDVNSYTIGKVKAAIKRGVKIEDENNPIYLYEDMIYSTSEEKAYLRGPNELFKDMEASGISYQQMSEYVFHKRVILEGRRAQNSFQSSLMQIQESLGPELYQRLIDEVSAYRKLPKRKQDKAALYETLGNAEISPDQIDAFIRLTEGVHRGRSQMANPGGYTPRTSMDAIKSMKKRMGAEKFNRMENGIGVYQTFMRGYLIDRLREAQMLTPELQAHIEANPEYVTFAVSSYIQQSYGPGIYARIVRQVGTLQNISNPLTATLMKDLMIIKAINRKMAIKSTIDFLKENAPGDVKPAVRRWNGRRIAPREPYLEGYGPEWGMVTYLHLGKVEAYYVPRSVVKAFERNSREASLIYEAGRLTNWFWREVFVQMNPGFMAFNAIRDLLRLSVNMPGGSLAKMFPYWWRSIGPVYRRALGLSDDTITEMERGKMLITVEDRHGLSADDTQIEALMMQYHLQARSGMIRGAEELEIGEAFQKTTDFLQALGYAIEGMPKVAGYQYLKSLRNADGTPRYSDKEIAHMVRAIAGSPDFLRKGALYPFYNNLFLFSNAMKEGWRGDFEVLRQRPAEYAYKRLKYNIVPKLLVYGLLVGLAGKKMKEAYEKVSAYDLTNYIPIVLGEMEDGRVVYLRVPQDETGRFVGGLFWKMLMGRKASDVMALADYMAGQAPSLTPSVSVPMDLIAFYTGKNPYDSFRGRYAIPDRVFRAGGQSSVFSPDPAERWAAWQNDKAFLKYLSREMGGEILYKFGHNDTGRAKAFIDKVLGVPVLGTNLISRFIKVSDQGTRERLRNVTGDIRTRKYQASLFVQNKILDHIEAIDNPSPNDAKIAYMNLLMDKTYQAMLDTGKKTPDGKPILREPISQKDFSEMYMKWAFRTGGTPYLEALVSAQSKEEKAAILNEFLKRQKGE